MRRLWQVLGRSDFQAFLFALGAVLFNWPVLGIFHLKPPAILFTYLFGAWAATIAVLFMVARSGESSPPSKARRK